MEEIWKDIKGYEGLYKVSNLGRVKNIKFNRFIKPFSAGIGYLQVDLSRGNNRRKVLVHRLVAEAFIPNPENKLEVNHIDEDKTNNKVDNLEWCTRTENVNHGTRNERHSKALSIPIIAINLKTYESKEYYGTSNCAKQLGLHQGHITEVLKGRRNQTGGYTFKYK